MPRVFLADAQLDERAALRLLLLDLNMKVVGEAADWPTTLAKAPATHPDMLVVDWDLLPASSGVALVALRAACAGALIVVLISHLDARHQAALSAGADAFISKGETPDRVAERLRVAARSISILTPSPTGDGPKTGGAAGRISILTPSPTGGGGGPTSGDVV